jgi:catechol 2,3-dioxygenase-like lactoylglutathione lyase family enzyme
MMNPKLAVVSVWTEDVPAAAHFYRDLVGLELMHHHGGQPHFKIDDVILVLVEGKPTPATNATPEHFPIIAFSVDSLDFEIDKLSNLGIEMPSGVVETGNTRWVMFRDPAGNLLEYVENL